MPLVKVEKRARGRKPKMSEEEMAAEVRFREELIVCVRRQPALYDKSCKEFKDEPFKDSEWRKISAEVHRSASECKSTWKELRDKFRKHRKSLEKPSGSSADSVKPFPFYDELLWLTIHVQMRRTKTSVGPYQESEEDEGEEAEEEGAAVVVDLSGDKFEVYVQSEGSDAETPAKRTRSATKVSTGDENISQDACLHSSRKVRRELWQEDGHMSPEKASPKTAKKAASPATSVAVKKASKSQTAENSKTPDKSKTPEKSQAPQKNPATQKSVASLSPHLPMLSPTKKQTEQVKTAKENKKAADSLLMGRLGEGG